MDTISQRIFAAREDCHRDEFIKANINLQVSNISHGESKEQKLVTLLKSSEFTTIQSIIIYVLFQNEADHLSQYLRTRSLDAESFHGGVPAQQKIDIQNRFSKRKIRILVVTTAFRWSSLFGSRVQSIVHFSLPKSLESYVQVCYCHVDVDLPSRISVYVNLMKLLASVTRF